MNDKKCSMYSYKGGTGRTVATANIACILAKSNKKVVCIDMDLDGGGLSVVFKVSSKVNDLKSRINDTRRCIQDVLRKEWQYRSENDVIETAYYNEIINEDDFINDWWNKMYIDLGKEWGINEICEKLYFIPARFGTDSVETGAEMGHRFNRFINLLMENIKPDILICDSSSGLQDYSTMLIKSCDIIVTFFRWNEQAIEGTLKCSEYIFNKNPAIKMFLIPTAVPKASLINEYYRSIHTTGKIRIEGQISQINKMFIERNDFDQNKIEFYKNGIGESTALKWKEELLIFKENLNEEDINILGDYQDVSQKLIELMER